MRATKHSSNHNGLGGRAARLTVATVLGFMFAGMAVCVRAYPPAPHHLFYGVVRDELGNPVQADDAQVVLETLTGGSLRSPISPGQGGGFNYRLTVPLDSGLTHESYKPTALRPLLPFRLKVQIGSEIFLPLEMRGDFARMGQPAQRTRLDLTLGEDADGDGLPDAWERQLLLHLGRGSDLTAVQPDEDADGDGMSNLDEYLAGTYAFDGEDGFRLHIVRQPNGAAVLEFLAIRGRTYSVFSSEDLQRWEPMRFQVSSASAQPPSASYYATDTRRVQILLDSQDEDLPARFFRLRVQ